MNMGSVDFDWCLKGRDAALFAAVKALGLSYELKAVYKLEDDREEIKHPPGDLPNDNFSSVVVGDYSELEYLLLWDSFSGLSTNDLKFAAVCLLVVLCRVEPDEGSGEWFGARVDLTLVWAHYPTITSEACDYIRYGNEHCIGTIYVAAALIIEIPISVRTDATEPSVKLCYILYRFCSAPLVVCIYLVPHE